MKSIWRWLLVPLLSLTTSAVAEPIRLSFGSCSNQDSDQWYWSIIQSRHPDIWLWAGNSIYADQLGYFVPRRYGANIPAAPFVEIQDVTFKCFDGVKCYAGATPQYIAEQYAKMNASKDYQGFVKTVDKVLGTWDDRDFGLHSGDSRYRWREESKQLFLDFLGEPPSSPRRQHQGVYDSWLAPGPPGRRVAFYLLDIRYNKDPDERSNGDFLGERQWAWFTESLARYRDEAAVNIIVTSVQVLPPTPLLDEVWGLFPDARGRLLRTLAESRAKGIVLLSGDRQFAQLNAIRCGDTIIHELTSSGLTHSAESAIPPVLGVFERLTLWVLPKHHLVGETWFDKNFGEVDVDVLEDGTVSVVTRIMSLRSGFEMGRVVLERHLDGLSSGATWDAGSCEPVRGEEPASEMRQRIYITVGVVILVVVLLSCIAVAVCCACCGRSQREKPHEA